MIQCYPDVFTDMPGETDVKLTDNTPIRCKPYVLLYAMREEMGGMRPLRSPYAVMVKKKDGSNRVCVDFRKLNKIIEVDPETTTTAKDLF